MLKWGGLLIEYGRIYFSCKFKSKKFDLPNFHHQQINITFKYAKEAFDGFSAQGPSFLTSCAIIGLAWHVKTVVVRKCFFPSCYG